MPEGLQQHIKAKQSWELAMMKDDLWLLGINPVHRNILLALDTKSIRRFTLSPSVLTSSECRHHPWKAKYSRKAPIERIQLSCVWACHKDGYRCNISLALKLEQKLCHCNADIEHQQQSLGLTLSLPQINSEACSMPINISWPQFSHLPNGN